MQFLRYRSKIMLNPELSGSFQPRPFSCAFWGSALEKAFMRFSWREKNCALWRFRLLDHADRYYNYLSTISFFHKKNCNCLRNVTQNAYVNLMGNRISAMSRMMKILILYDPNHISKWFSQNVLLFCSQIFDFLAHARSKIWSGMERQNIFPALPEMWKDNWKRILDFRSYWSLKL